MRLKLRTHGTMKRHLLAVLTGIALLAAQAPALAGNLIEDIVQRGKIRVGMSSFTPWAMRSKEGGFIGFEIDVAQKVADDMGVELELVPTSWDGIIPALIAEKFDVIIGGMSITPQRNLKVNFSIPYANSGMDFVANKDTAPGHSEFEDFNRPDYVVSIRRGTSALEIVRRHMPKAQIRQFDDERTALQEAINGNAHGFATSAPVPAFAAVDHPDKLYLPFDRHLDTSSEGFGLRKGDADALNFFNNWIMVQRQKGWLQERHDYWFRGKDWADRVDEG